MKEYESPEIRLIAFEAMDVIATSLDSELDPELEEDMTIKG